MSTATEINPFPLTFGKHRGMKTTEIYKVNPGYISWLVQATADEALRNECVAVLSGKIGVTDSERIQGEAAFVEAVKQYAKEDGRKAKLSLKTFLKISEFARLAGVLNLQSWNACFMDDTASIEVEGVVYRLCYNSQQHKFKDCISFSHHYSVKIEAAAIVA